MYWNLGDAKAELIRRQEDKELMKRVDEFLGSFCPIPKEGFRGFLTRHIASSRLEDIQFEERCREVGLEPTFLEYQQDIFVSGNPSKVRLVRLYTNGYSKNGREQLIRIDLVGKNLDGKNKIPLNLIKTLWEESLVQFHHRTREMIGLKGEMVDLSDWLKSIGRAKVYYKYLLAASVIRGIIFESFESPGFPDLDRFTQEVVLPAWEWVHQMFDSPLIVRHPDVSDSREEERILNWYPPSVLEAIPEEFRGSYR